MGKGREGEGAILRFINFGGGGGDFLRMDREKKCALLVILV